MGHVEGMESVGQVLRVGLWLREGAVSFSREEVKGSAWYRRAGLCALGHLGLCDAWLLHPLLFPHWLDYFAGQASLLVCHSSQSGADRIWKLIARCGRIVKQIGSRRCKSLLAGLDRARYRA